VSVPAVFLDRDGTVNESVASAAGLRPPWSVDELRVDAATPALLERLHGAGYLLVIVTNQPDVARGTLAADVLEAINAALVARLGVDALYVCANDTADDCACRKPRPGLILDAAADHDVDLSRSWLIGDRWVDVAAGVAAGVRSLLLRHEGSWRATTSGGPPAGLAPEAEFATLAGAVEYILGVSPPAAVRPSG
jgi:D-glycero-D-manno-heptose 1,7-bisphosphate phosphatase